MGHPPDPDEAITISDQQMVFTSEEKSPPKQISKKLATKLKRAKLVSRRSTPAPPTKGDGQKRFVPSPLPEDKQLRKRIDFGEQERDSADSPKCKGPIFPATPAQEMEDSSRSEEHKQNGNDNVRDLEGVEAELIASPRKNKPAGVEPTATGGDDNPTVKTKHWYLVLQKQKESWGKRKSNFPKWQ